MKPVLTPAAGLGLKPQHFQHVLDTAPALGFFEVHAENYMVAGGPFHHYLSRIRERFELSVHGVGLSIGAQGGLNKDHLDRLRVLLDRYQPQSFSEHLAWSSHGLNYYNDLLPVPYHAATLQRVCDHVDQLQEHVGRQVLIENPATYVEFASTTMTEAEFLSAVVRRTGCGLLLDVNNAHVSAVNHRRDPKKLIDALPLDQVGEIHLAGFAQDQDAAGAPLLIDSHGSPVHEQVWGLYRYVLQRMGPVATLLERDNDIPPWPVLLAEALQAQALLDASQGEARGRRHE